MTKNLNIILAIILIIFYLQTTLSNKDIDIVKLWFPTKLPEEKSVVCGLDYDISGISVVDDYLFQFQKCAVIIYPPPLEKYLDESFNHLKLDNGYRYLFKEVLVNEELIMCSSKSDTLMFSMIRRKTTNDERYDHVLVYRHQYHKVDIYDLEKYLDENPIHPNYDDDSNSIMKIVTDGEEFYRLVNDQYEHKAYRILGDKATEKKVIDFGIFCVKKNNNSDGYSILKTDFDSCGEENLNLTRAIIENIYITFAAHKKAIIFTGHENMVLIFDIKLFLPNNNDELPLEIKTKKDFLICSRSDQPKTEKTKIMKFLKDNIFIIIPVISVILIIIIGGIIFTVYMKRKKKNPINKKDALMKSKSSLLTTTGLNKKTTTSNTFSSKIFNKITSITIPTNNSITTTTTGKTINR